MGPAVEHWLDAPDGSRLSVVDVPPKGTARLVAIVGHAMMVDRRTVYREDRPSLCGALADASIRVLVPDLRGHGASGPSAAQGADWTYEDLIDDVGRYIALAQQLEPELPIVLVGNSLFGHVGLAHVGAAATAPVAAIVGFAVNIWNKRWNVGAHRWWIKRSLIELSRPAVEVLGYLPTKRIGFGSSDESGAYWRDMVRWVRSDTWGNAAGDDYVERLGRVRRPFLHVVSEGDRLLSRPEDALRFSEPLAEYREILKLGANCSVPALRHLRPGHVEMVSDPECLPLWNHVAHWMLGAASG
ncbi:MAG: alpha/beta fold hydrolase [Polyangiaceae bacterium]